MSKVFGFLMVCGYVEGARNGLLYFRHRDGFDTADEALASLRKCFLRYVESFYAAPCVDFRGEGPYCSKCRHIQQDHLKPEDQGVYHEEDIKEAVGDWLAGDADSTHDMWDILENAGWSTHPTNLEGLIVIDQQGEIAIAKGKLDWQE